MTSKRLNTVVELLEIFPFIDKFAKNNRLTSKFKIVCTQVFIVRCQKCVKSNYSLKIPNQIHTCKISLWQQKTKLQNQNEIWNSSFSQDTYGKFMLLVWKGKKNLVKPQVCTWKCIYNPFCHLPSADNFPSFLRETQGQNKPTQKFGLAT